MESLWAASDNNNWSNNAFFRIYVWSFANQWDLKARGIHCHDNRIFTARNSSWGKVMFSQACVKNSVHGDVCPKEFWDIYPPRQTSPWAHPPLLGRHPPSWADTLPSRHPLGRHPLGRHPLNRHPSPPPRHNGYGQQAGDMHPTGMHSCILYIHPVFSQTNIVVTEQLVNELCN